MNLSNAGAAGLHSGFPVDQLTDTLILIAEVLQMLDQLGYKGSTLLLIRPRLSRWARQASRSSANLLLMRPSSSFSPRSESTSLPASSTCPARTRWVYSAALRSLAKALFLWVSACVAFWACCPSALYLSLRRPISATACCRSASSSCAFLMES